MSHEIREFPTTINSPFLNGLGNLMTESFRNATAILVLMGLLCFPGCTSNDPLENDATDNAATNAGSGELIDEVAWEYERLGSYEGHTLSVWSVAVDHESETLISGSMDGLLGVWNINDSQPGQFLGDGESIINCLEFDSANRLAVTGDSDGRVEVWNVDTGDLNAEFAFDEEEIRGVALDPARGHVLACNQQGQLKVWNLRSGEVDRTLDCGVGTVFRVVFDLEAAIIATGGVDGVVRLYNLESGELIQSFEASNGIIASIDLDSSARRMVTGDFEGSVKLWDLDSRECLQTFLGHTGFVQSVLYEAAGTVASCAQDKSVKHWDIETGEILHSHDFGFVPTLFWDSVGDAHVFLSDSGTINLWRMRRVGE